MPVILVSIWFSLLEGKGVYLIRFALQIPNVGLGVEHGVNVSLPRGQLAR